MKEFSFSAHKLTLYHSADELPIGRYAKFQKYNLVDAGIGADLTAVAAHFAKLFSLLGARMPEDALTEAKNLYYNFHLLLEETSPQALSFCVLLQAIDGEPVTDLSEDHLKALVTRLSDMGVTKGFIADYVRDVKKKSSLT